jgi:CelD/BcsL family acetyltransferase involved in cellulose biosynthesis
MIEFNVEHSFDFASEEYQNLYERGGMTAFQHPIWMSSFYRHLPEAMNFEPVIVTGRMQGYGLVLLIPMLRRAGGPATAFEFAFMGVSDYAAPALAPEVARAFYERGRLRTFLQAQGALGLSIEPIRAEHRGVWEMLLGGELEVLHHGSHACPLQKPYDVRSILGARKGRDLERKKRRLKELGEVSFEALGRDDAGRAIFEAAKIRAGRFKDDPLQHPAFIAFYSEVAAYGQKTGYSTTYRLSCSGATVAILFGVTWRKRFCYLLLACDLHHFAAYSPGYLIFDQAMEDWTGRAGDVFDFTVGDETFKSRFCPEREPLFRMT